jgi:hypothetical protein
MDLSVISEAERLPKIDCVVEKVEEKRKEICITIASTGLGYGTVTCGSLRLTARTAP